MKLEELPKEIQVALSEIELISVLSRNVENMMAFQNHRTKNTEAAQVLIINNVAAIERSINEIKYKLPHLFST